VKRLFTSRSRVPILGYIGLMCASLFLFCTQDNPTSLEPNDSYSFTGFVLDGYTGKALGGAVVTYYNENGDSVTQKTRADGGFVIDKIPYGDRSFYFTYTPALAGAVQYTSAAVTIEGNDWEAFHYNGIGVGLDSALSASGDVKNVAGPVKLYPLSGSLTGNVYSQVHARAALNTIKNVVVKATFNADFGNQGNNDAVIGSNVEVGPRTFEVMTDSTGKFTFAGIPVSGDENELVNVKVISVTVNGIDWAMDDDGLDVELASGQIVPVGSIIMNPIVKIALTDLDNNFKTSVINPEHSFIINYSDTLDTLSYAVLDYTTDDAVKHTVPVDVTVSGTKITIDPEYSLINDEVYTLNMYVYGKKGQSVTKLFNNISVTGGGLADVIASNVLTNTKTPVYNFGKSAPVFFKFGDSIIGNPSVAVSNNDVIYSASHDTLIITPKGLWQSGDISVSVVLKDSSTVSFSTPLNLENALAFVTSNVYDFINNTPKNGLALNTPIVFSTNKSVASVNAILTIGGASLPVSARFVEGSTDDIEIVPVNTLKAAQVYTLTVTVASSIGESKSVGPFNFTTSAAQFYSISDNVRIGNDKDMPRLDFAPNANIVIRMNKKVTKASSSMTNVNVKTTISNDSIIIDPETILTEGTAYTLSVTAEDSVGQTISGNYVVGLVPRALVYIVASNVITADNSADQNAAKDVSPWFKMSSAPVAAKMRVELDPMIDAVVTVLGDTLVINPVSDFKYDENVTVDVKGEAADGNYISFTKTFKVMKQPVISLVASNVTNSNYEGLTNVVESIELWYKLSRTPAASSIIATVDGKDPVVRVSGDTVFLKSPVNFGYGAAITVTLRGQDVTGITFDFTSNPAATWPNWKSFTTRQALYPVASNTWGLTGFTADNFPVYGEMWVKYSQPLSTDLTKIVWDDGTAAKDLYGKLPSGETPNASVRVSNDTLFVTPIQNRVALNYNDVVGFNVDVAGVNGVTSGAKDFKVNYEQSKLFVSATNTVYPNAVMIDTLGKTQTVWLVSSLPFTEVIAINDIAGNLTGGQNLEVKRTIRVSGDTIFFTPFEELGLDVQYEISFDVKLANGLKGDNDELKMTWKTRKATNLYVKATNVQANGLTVDTMGALQTVWIIPSAPIDSIDQVLAYDNGSGTAENTPDDNGAGVNLLKERIRLSAAGDTIFWTPVDTLDYGKNYGIKYNVTLTTGEQFTGSELAVVWKTKPGIRLVSTNDMSDAAHTVYRVFKCKGDSLVATFSKAVDTSKTPKFSVTGFGAAGKLVYTWNTAFTTVTIKDTSKLTPKTYAPVQNYTTSGTPEYDDITFSVVTFDGEIATVTANDDYDGVRPDLAIHTEDKLVAIDASYLKEHTADAITAGDDGIDSVLPTANITITFNRAIDTAAIKAAARDKYFKFVKSTAPNTNLDYAISFTNAGKTVTIDPVADSLVREGIYYVIADAIPDLTSGDEYDGVGTTTVGAVIKALTDDGFSIKAAAKVTSIAALATVITLDTNEDNSSVNPINGKRIGASPMQTAYDGLIEVNSATALSFRIQEAAWNAKHIDSVGAYQYRIRKVTKTGAATDWFEVATPIAKVDWSTAWNSVTVNAANADRRVTIDPTNDVAVLTGNFISNLLTPDRDGDVATDYSNGANLFNDSSRIDVQVRAVKDLSIPADADVLDAGEFGTWSSTISFVDNVAPCDSDFVATANCNVLASGGVTVNPIGTGDIYVLDRTNPAAGVGTYNIDITFPEDMDTSSDASIALYYEVVLGAGETPITSAGVWTSARTYRLSLTLASGINYADNVPYYSISVAGMKDASGVTIQTYGDIGTAANAVLRTTADDTEDQGPSNVQLLQSL